MIGRKENTKECRPFALTASGDKGCKSIHVVNSLSLFSPSNRLRINRTFDRSFL